MGVDDFQIYLKEKFPNLYIQQDLLDIAQGVALKFPKHQHDAVVNKHPGGLRVLIDGECCLDRLYGGYFTDWACGGQWNRVIEFLRLLLNTMRSAHMQVVVFFNGAFEEKRFTNWKVQQTANAEKVRQILQHVKRKHTPPPKILWMPPAALRNAIRLILRHLVIPVHMTLEDHKQEVMSFVREGKFDVLLAEGAEYLFFDPPRYFSAASLRLTFRGSLDVQELVSEDVAKFVDLHPNRFCLIPAILGTFLQPAEDFQLFYEELLPTASTEERKDIRVVLPAVVAFIRNLPNIDDLHAVGNFMFRNDKDREDKVQRFENSVHYYMNATVEGFHKYFKPKSIT